MLISSFALVLGVAAATVVGPTNSTHNVVPHELDTHSTSQPVPAVEAKPAESHVPKTFHWVDTNGVVLHQGAATNSTAKPAGQGAATVAVDLTPLKWNQRYACISATCGTGPGSQDGDVDCVRGSWHCFDRDLLMNFAQHASTVQDCNDGRWSWRDCAQEHPRVLSEAWYFLSAAVFGPSIKDLGHKA